MPDAVRKAKRLHWAVVGENNYAHFMYEGRDPDAGLDKGRYDTESND